jgi:hypothetical protein
MSKKLLTDTVGQRNWEFLPGQPLKFAIYSDQAKVSKVSFLADIEQVVFNSLN